MHVAQQQQSSHPRLDAPVHTLPPSSMSALRKLRAARQQQQTDDHSVQATDSTAHSDIGATPSVSTTDTPSSSTATSSTLSAAITSAGRAQAQAQAQAGHKTKRKHKQPQLRPVYSTAVQ